MESIDQATLVRVVQGATMEVFNTMLGLELSAGEVYSEEVPPPPTEGVVSLIGMAGRWVGTGCIYCSGELACRLTSIMLMTEPVEAVSEEVLDVIGELTNMIIGNVKTGLEESLGPMGLSIPTVVYGRNFSARNASEGAWTVFPFTLEGETFQVKIFLAPSRKPLVHVRPGFPHSYSLQG
ncbi:MAG TPA: chemotaxis protein CheX [Anaerolineaceae bacterium]|nr:chemotaxis protein CheX [Anaerolineaceae bacterium]